MKKHILLAGFLILSFDALAIDLIMPKELVDVANENNCEQIKNFYEIVAAYGPPFVYGVVHKDKEREVDGLKSAAYWCRDNKKNDTFSLRLFVDESLKSVNQCPLLIDRVTTYIGALSVKSGNWELDKFRAVVDKKKVAGYFKGDAIISEAEAYQVVYICYKGQWLKKEMD